MRLGLLATSICLISAIFYVKPAKPFAAPDETDLLVDQVLRFPHTISIPPELLPFIQTRLKTAEAGFWQHSHNGVKEEDIVRLFDLVSARLNLPEYTKTSARQVRELRMEILATAPAFMGKGMVQGPMKIGESISSTLSPAQAVHLIQVLIDQKFLNPRYQVSPAEWEQMSPSTRLTIANSLREPNSPDHSRVQALKTAHRRELEGRLTEGIRKMSSADQFSLLNETLNIIGLD